jgi:hypothetical protein
MLTLLVHFGLFILFLTTALWLISRSKFFSIEGTKREYFYGLFLLKVLAGVVLIVIYTYYYTDPAKADIYRYFNDSVIISKLLFTQSLAWLKVMSGIGIEDADAVQALKATMYFSHPGHDWVTENTLIISAHVLLNYVTFYNIYINNLWLNFLSFVGLVAIFRAFAPYFQENRKMLLLPLFLLPSVVFWSSGPLKEQLIFMFLGLYVSSVFSKLFKPRWVNLFLAFVAIMGIAYLKPAVAIVLVFASVFLPVVNLYNTKRLIAAVLFALLLIAVAVSFDWHYKACEIVIEKRNEFTRLGLQENVGSFFDTHLINKNCGELLSLLPSAFANSFLRPFVWDGGNVFQWLFAFENLFFVYLLFYLLFRFFQLPDAKEKRLLFAFCLVFALLNYFVIGLTVPIMGAIVHYRVIAAPFLLIAVLCFCNVSLLELKRKPR